MSRRKNKRVPNEHPQRLSGQDIRNVIYDEMSHFLTDIEYRVAQAYEVTKRNTTALMEAGELRAKIFAEDLSLNQHIITGYTVTANTPTAGNIAWSNLHLVYGGIDYNIANGNTTSSSIYYLWADITAATAGADATHKNLTLSQNPITSKPVLVNGNAVIFLNSGGTPISVLEQNIPRVVGDNAIDSGALQSGSVTGAKVSTVQGSTLTGANLTNNTITSTQVGTGANGLGSTNIQNGAVQNANLAAFAVNATNLSILDHTIY